MDVLMTCICLRKLCLLCVWVIRETQEDIEHVSNHAKLIHPKDRVPHTQKSNLIYAVPRQRGMQGILHW